MSGFPSPDVPAYLCYLVVLVVGVFVARYKVNRLLASNPDHWGFVGTWWLFLAYVAIPIPLLWFLDYTSVLHDTSLFAALLVALFYQQIFSGSVQGVAMPGQTSAFWKPFELWVTRVADRIAAKNLQYRASFEEAVKSSLSDAQAIQKFEELAYERSKDPGALRANLTAIRAPGQPPGAEARARVTLWQDFRLSEPDQYGDLLYRRGLVKWSQYWFWLRNGRSKLISAIAIVLVPVVALSLYFWLTYGSVDGAGALERLALRYHQGRFLKTTATERDRWRTWEYFANELRSAETTPAHPVENPAQRIAAARRILDPLVDELRYPEVTARVIQDTTRLVLDCHSPVTSSAILPQLIETLRTPNEVVRLKVQNTIVDLQKKDFAAAPAPDFKGWVPSKDEGPAAIDEKVKLWKDWWRSVSVPAPAADPRSTASNE